MTRIHTMTEFALYTAVAFLFSFIESLIPLPLPFPGMKLGLANVVLLFVLYRKNFRYTLGLSLLRNVLTALTFGNLFALLYSIGGAVLSLVVMTLVKHYGKERLSIISISALGGVMHNMGQLLTAIFLVGFSSIIWYLPILYFCGLITGIFIGFIGKLCVERIGH